MRVRNFNTLTGPSDGGGGKGVVCRKNGKTSVELLDLWGARNVYKRTIVVSNADAGDQAYQAFDRMRGAFSGERVIGIWQIESAFWDQQAYRMAERDSQNDHFISIRKPNKLAPTNDSFEEVVPNDPDCTIEQLANNNLDGAQIKFNDDLIDLMDNTNRAALYLHEALYTVLHREADETTSIRIRRTIGFVFSGHAVDPVDKYLSSPRYTCENVEGNPRTLIYFVTLPGLSAGGSPQVVMIPEIIAEIPMIGASLGGSISEVSLNEFVKSWGISEKSSLTKTVVDFDTSYNLSIGSTDGYKRGDSITLRNSANGKKNLAPIKLNCKMVN